MLLHSIRKPIGSLVILEQGDALLEAPVVDEPCDSCMSVKVRPLLVVGVELIPVGFVDQHRSQEIVLIMQFKAIQSFVKSFQRVGPNDNVRDIQFWVNLSQRLVTRSYEE